MIALPDFKITANQAISQEFLKRGMLNFHTAIDFVRSLPYQRISDRSRLELVLEEQRGTCSAKHAVLAQLAKENGQTDIQLVLGMYKMNGQNTGGVGRVLNAYGFDYIPEAHTYLSYRQQRFDFTTAQGTNPNVFENLLEEKIISPEQTALFKIQYHQQFLQQWIKTQQLVCDLTFVWEVRGGLY